MSFQTNTIFDAFLKSGGRSDVRAIGGRGGAEGGIMYGDSGPWLTAMAPSTQRRCREMLTHLPSQNTVSSIRLKRIPMRPEIQSK